MSRVDNKLQGFTLIELMLAMGFVSALLLAIAMTVVQIGDIYNRGITTKNTNQAGSSLASELQRNINESTSFDVTPGAGHYVVQAGGGRLCMNQYSYIWNYGSVLPNNPSNEYASPDSSTKIYFVKVSDSNSSYCAKSPITGKYNSVVFSSAVELLDVGQNNLALQSFTITSAASDPKTKQQLYNIEFQLGTNDQATLTTNPSTGDIMCRPPSDLNSNSSYCAVNRFDIVARAGNTVE